MADSTFANTTIKTGVRVSCTPRIQPLPASTSRMPGNPRMAIRSQDTAAAATASSLPTINRINGSAISSPTPIRTTPIISASQDA